MKLFGFEFLRIPKPYEMNPIGNSAISFVDKNTEDTAAAVAASASFGTYVDIQGTIKTEAELITKYRDMMIQPEIVNATDEIINEAICTDEEYIVKIDLDDLPFDDNSKSEIDFEFQNILKFLDFKSEAYNIFKRWYVDGRLYYDIVIDNNHPDLGIMELRYVDPRKIREIKEIERKKLQSSSDLQNISEISVVKNNYYLYNEKGFGGTNKAESGLQGTQTGGIRIAKDSIIHVPSGLTNSNGTMGLGYLHQGIKILNQLRTIEDSLIIYRLARAPERRVWYVDVGELPKAKAEQYVRDVMISQKNKIIYDADTGCFALDTKIPLLDGRTLSIEEISKEYKEKELWTYSCDPKTGNFVPGLITWAGMTKPSAKVMKITLDNNESFICTYEHKFPTWEGDKKASELKIGESMIPLYRRDMPINKKEPKIKYEELYNNSNKKWEFTHRLVSKWKDKNNFENEFVYNPLYTNEKKLTIHHINYDKYNNEPYNLTRMNNKDHWKLHSDIIADRIKNNPEKFKCIWTDEMRENSRERGKLFPHEKFIKMNKIANKVKWGEENGNNNKKKLSVSQIIIYTEEIYNLLEESAQKDLSMKDTIKYINNNINKELWNSINIDKKTKNRNVKNLQFSYKDIMKISKEMGFSNWKSYRFSKNKILGLYSSYKEASEITGLSIDHLRHKNATLNKSNEISYKNHKIISIEYLEEEIPVGTLTIDGQEKYFNGHTFALSVGIYTYNSQRDDRKFMTMLEDFWIPRRSDGAGTQVQTLQGGATLGQIDDILYFQKQLYGALNVPVGRINPDAPFMLGHSQEISRDEIKFDKFITRLRQQFSNLFTKALGRQLILKGMFTIEEWEEYEKDIKYEYSRDNHFAELKDQEILMSRAQTAVSLQPYVGIYFSNRQIRREIFKQTDEDIEKITAEIAEEMNDPIYQMATQAQQEAEHGPPEEDDQEEEEEAPSNDGSSKKSDTKPSKKSYTKKKYESARKVEDARAIIQALHSLKSKTPEEEKKLRSAAAIVSRYKDKK